MDGPVSTTDVDEAIELWQTRGWVVVDGLVPTTDIDAAVEPDLWEMYPRPEDYFSDDRSHAERYELESGQLPDRPDGPDDGQSFRLRQFLGHRHMPYPGSGRLNRLCVHPNVVSFAKRAMGSDDIRIYQTRIWGKYTGVTNYDQPFHQDRNHNVVPDRLEPGWWNLEGFLYLTDVFEGVAPTQIGGLGEHPPDPDGGAPAEGVRGSYLAYRPDVWHRGVDLTRPGGYRFLMNIAFKHAGHEWIGYDSPQSNSTRPMWCKFVASCTPEELALFGVPRPGHEYWTEDLVRAMGERYRGLDLTPWLEAL